MADSQLPENSSSPEGANAPEGQGSPPSSPTIILLPAPEQSHEADEAAAAAQVEASPLVSIDQPEAQTAVAAQAESAPEAASPDADPGSETPAADLADSVEPASPTEAEPAELAESGAAEGATAEPAESATAEASIPEPAEVAPVREEPVTRPEVPPAPSFEAPRRSQRAGMMALLKLDKVDEDDTFRLRSDGEIDSLATSIAKLGQLFPVELRLKPPDRFQVVCGFRRVAALRLLKRERVVARVYTDLGDEDALQLSLADLLENRSVSHDELVALRERLRGENRLFSSVADTLDRAISPPGDTLCPETVDGPEEEVDLDELAQELLGRLAAVNQDLALVVELWSALEPGLRDALLEQLGYPEQLGSYLRGLR